MDTFLRILFIASCFATGIATFVMIVLSPKPATLLDHAKGGARVMIVAGALFCIASAVSGTTPEWYVLCLVIGFGFLIILHTKDIYLRARDLERAERDAATNSGLTTFKGN